MDQVEHYIEVGPYCEEGRPVAENTTFRIIEDVTLQRTLANNVR